MSSDFFLTAMGVTDKVKAQLDAIPCRTRAEQAEAVAIFLLAAGVILQHRLQASNSEIYSAFTACMIAAENYADDEIAEIFPAAEGSA